MKTCNNCRCPLVVLKGDYARPLCARCAGGTSPTPREKVYRAPKAPKRADEELLRLDAFMQGPTKRNNPPKMARKTGTPPFDSST